MAKVKVRNTIADAIYGFKDLTDKSQLSDDSGFSNRWIYFFLLRHRAKLLREKSRQGGRLTQFNYQTIPCVELEEIDLAECPCVPKSGCTFLKAKFPIPQSVGKLKSVTSVDGQITYSFVEWERLKSKINSRIPAQSNKAYYTIKDTGEGTYLYLYNNVHRKHLTVTGIFEDPLQVQLYPTCEGDSFKLDCANYLEQQFILDPDLLGIVYDLALTQLKSKFQATDNLNDDNDNLVSNAGKLK